MTIKLVVTDMDGTLLGSDSHISTANLQALCELDKQGVRVAIATGRLDRAVRSYVRAMGVATPVIGLNGALVRCSDSGQIYYSQPLGSAAAENIISVARKYDAYFHYYCSEAIHGERLEYVLGRFSRWNQTLRPQDRVHINHVAEIELALASGAEPYQFAIALEDSSVLNAIASELSQVDGIECFRSLENMLNVVSTGVSKGKAVERLAVALGLNREEIMAIGDQENDASMLEYAGLSVAMGNATELVKGVADFITSTNDDDGFAQAVKKHVLESLII